MSQSNVFYEMSEKSSYHKINFIIKGLGIKIKDMCILKTKYTIEEILHIVMLFLRTHRRSCRVGRSKSLKYLGSSD